MTANGQSTIANQYQLVSAMSTYNQTGSRAPGTGSEGPDRLYKLYRSSGRLIGAIITIDSRLKVFTMVSIITCFYAARSAEFFLPFRHAFTRVFLRRNIIKAPLKFQSPHPRGSRICNENRNSTFPPTLADPSFFDLFLFLVPFLIEQHA